MKRVWLTEPSELLGGIGTSWLQRYGISRNARTGAWTIHDHRDARPNHEGSSIVYWRYADTDDLLDNLLEFGWELSDLLKFVEGRPEPDLQRLAAEIRSRM